METRVTCPPQDAHPHAVNRQQAVASFSLARFYCLVSSSNGLISPLTSGSVELVLIMSHLHPPDSILVALISGVFGVEGEDHLRMFLTLVLLEDVLLQEF